MGQRTPEVSPARTVGQRPGGNFQAASPAPRSLPGFALPDDRVRSAIPQRYRLRRADRDSVLLCDEAPRVHVRVRRDYSFSEADARALGPRVILLDGAGSFGPLLDNSKRLYNLDHHAGCERTFTLATCEQALLLVHSGLDLANGDWSVYANEPDLDTVLAIWCLLNHARLRDLPPSSRDVLLPVLRLEGATDANGHELAAVCGLPGEVLDAAQKRVDALVARERAAKAGGTWQTLDPEAYTVDMLHEIDHLVYSVEDFRDYTSIDEIYGHTVIDESHVFVVCRDGAGIYAVEKLLKERWGDQLGIIALEKEPGHYTLRRASPLSDIDLNVAYSSLNLLDRNVDGRPPSKRWGGSDVIGGSPRPSGSSLSPAELLAIVGRAYQRRGGMPRLWAMLRVALLATALVLGGALVGALAASLAPSSEIDEDVVAAAGLSLSLASASVVLSWLLSRRRLWLHGWRWPAGRDWLALVPLALPAAALTRACFPAPASLGPAAVAQALGAALLAAVGLEACFRGLVHGLLQADSRVQTVAGPWHISSANLVSALLFCLATLALSLPRLDMPPGMLFPARDWLLALALASLVGGLALGCIRERSLSLWPCVAVQLLGGLMGSALWLWLAAS